MASSRYLASTMVNVGKVEFKVSSDLGKDDRESVMVAEDDRELVIVGVVGLTI